MSLNHLTDCEDNAKTAFNIGCNKMCCDLMEAETHIANTMTTNSLTINNQDGSTTTINPLDSGTPGYALKTDGLGGTYWGADETTAGGINYAGTQPAVVGNHIKLSTTDASLVVESKLNETATDLNMNNLKITNLTDPTNLQDGATKNYVDTAISSNADVNKQLATGVYSGGHLTINVDTTKFDITAGTGIIVNPSTGSITNVSWGNATGISILGGNVNTYVEVNSSGNIVLSNTEPTATENRDKLFLGKIIAPNTINIETIDEHIYTALNVGNSLIDLSKALGHINLSGNVISKGSALMSIQKTEGYIYAYGANFFNDIKNPSNLFLPAGDTASGLVMVYYMKNGNISTPQTTINPNYYDNGTNYPGATITTNEWSVQRVFSSSSNENNLHIMLGQDFYVQKQDAINAISTEVFEVPQELIDDDVLLGYIVVQQGETDLTNAEFIRASKFSGVGGSGSAPAIDLSKIANFTSATQTPDITNMIGLIRNDGTAPTNANDLTNKAYVDSVLSGTGFVAKTGDNMTGNLDMGANFVLSTAAPSLTTHLTNKQYVDNENANYLPLAGGTMTGSINMNTNTNINNVNAITLYNTGGFLTTLSTNASASYNMTLPPTQGTAGQILETNGTGQLNFVDNITPYDILVACSDETTALTAGTGKATFRIPRAFTLTGVKASLTTAQTSGSILTIDIKLNGTSILSTLLTIDNGEKTSTTAATPAVISNSNMTDDAEISVDITQVGDGTATGLKTTLIGSA